MADLHLDHVGFIVRDLEAAADLLTQLGFTLTARADHTRTDERGVAVPAGSSQRSVMLHNGYIEFMQITDPLAGHQLASAPSVRFGLHILAFGTEDAKACHEWCEAQSLDVGPVLRWSRPVNEGGVQGLARFAYFGAAWEPRDPSYLCWVQHVTPELMRPAPLLGHPNTALAVREVHYEGPRERTGPWVSRLQAAGARFADGDVSGANLELPNARIRVGFDDSVDSVTPSALLLEFADCAAGTARTR